jgi:hypothetical protein
VSYPNSQGNAAASIPVWDAGGPPTPDSQGRFPNAQDNPNAAIPVYQVTGTPTDTPPFPNDQGAIEANPPQGALPIRIVAKPTPDALGRFPNDPANDNAAIPVYFVATPIPVVGSYPNAQNNPNGAIPVWVVA